MTVNTLEADGVHIHAIRAIGKPDKLTHRTARPPRLANGNDRTDAEKTQAIAWRQSFTSTRRQPHPTERARRSPRSLTAPAEDPAERT